MLPINSLEEYRIRRLHQHLVTIAQTRPIAFAVLEKLANNLATVDEKLAERIG